MNEQASSKAPTAALVLGILGWLMFFGSYPGPAAGGDLGDALYYRPVAVLSPVILPLLALVFGHLGLRAAPVGARSRRRSVAALVLGYLLLTVEAARFVSAAI